MTTDPSSPVSKSGATFQFKEPTDKNQTYALPQELSNANIHGKYEISLKHFLPENSPRWKHWIASVMDSITGIRRLNQIYKQHEVAGLPASEFLQNLLNMMQWKVELHPAEFSKVPTMGSCILVANHPYGGLEGVLLAKLIGSIRPDIKILANLALEIFPELSPYFIFTNPLKPGAYGNLTSIRQCQQHLRKGGLLIVFPAGRVSYPRSIRDAIQGNIQDHRWDRLPVQLSQACNCPILHLFIGGRNRQRFYWLGLLHYRLRLLMLVRELLASRGKTIPLQFSAHTIVACKYKGSQMQTDLSRLLTYLQDPAFRQHWPQAPEQNLSSIATPQVTATLQSQIGKLPKNQKLLQYKNFHVYIAKKAQCPAVIEEIRRLREISFRELDEGSGNPVDGDEFDESYLHLFVFDIVEQEIIGAYRMGPTDQLLEKFGVNGLYLSRMFEFRTGFVNFQQPCLEMGRSFIIAKHQKSFHALLLLFRGIAAYVGQNPQYSTLYGTVSLSKQYDPLSVYLMSRVLAHPSEHVKARQPFDHLENPELLTFLERNPLNIDDLDMLIRQIESDGKGLPVLVRQYHQLGARFYAVGIDPNFASTPGFLLSVDLKTAPYKQLKLFFANSLNDFLANVTTTSFSD